MYDLKIKLSTKNHNNKLQNATLNTFSVKGK